MAAGPYKMKVRYSNTEETPVSILDYLPYAVNYQPSEEPIKSLSTPTTVPFAVDSDPWYFSDSAEVIVNLKDGTNTVQLGPILQSGKESVLIDSLSFVATEAQEKTYYKIELHEQNKCLTIGEWNDFVNEETCDDNNPK